MKYLVRCYDCPVDADADEDTTAVSQSDWFGKARSDADWHNTNTGHDSFVIDTESREVVYTS